MQVLQRSGVYCQHFFICGPGAQFFEVQVAGSSPAMLSRDVDLEAIKKRLNQEMQQADEEQHRQITTLEESQEPNPQLRHVGQVEYSEAFDQEELRALVAPVKDNEPELEVLYKVFNWLI